MEENAHGDRVGKRARSSSGEPCQSNLYPRSWGSQRIFSRRLTSSGLHFTFLMSILFIYLFGHEGLCFKKQVLLIFVAASGI